MRRVSRNSRQPCGAGNRKNEPKSKMKRSAVARRLSESRASRGTTPAETAAWVPEKRVGAGGGRPGPQGDFRPYRRARRASPVGVGGAVAAHDGWVSEDQRAGPAPE